VRILTRLRTRILNVSDTQVPSFVNNSFGPISTIELACVYRIWIIFYYFINITYFINVTVQAIFYLLIDFYFIISYIIIFNVYNQILTIQ